jgi:hypothetical protein
VDRLQWKSGVPGTRGFFAWRGARADRSEPRQGLLSNLGFLPQPRIAREALFDCLWPALLLRA